MIFHLATLALAFMTFTASAKSSLPRATDSEVPVGQLYGSFGTKCDGTVDIMPLAATEGKDGCERKCFTANATGKVFESVILGINDKASAHLHSCYFYYGPDCTGNYTSVVRGVTYDHKGNEVYNACQITNMTGDGETSFVCAKGECPPTVPST